MSSGSRAHLVSQVAAAVYARLAATSSHIIGRDHPDYGTDFSALLASASATAEDSAVDTIDLVDSPQPAAPRSKRRRHLTASPVEQAKRPRAGDIEAQGAAEDEEVPIFETSPVRKVAAPSPPRAPRATKDAAPKRGAMTRVVPSKQLLARLDRAQKHPIYLVDRRSGGRVFDVMGATGNVYEVKIERDPSCACPDFQKRCRGEGSAAAGPCKHILFVMHRVLKVDRMDMKLYQVSLLDDEVEEIFRAAPPAPHSHLLADGGVTTAFRESQQRDDDSDADGEDPECPICFEVMDNPNAPVRCTACCGRVHGTCMAQVLTHRDGMKTCPLCRGEWQETAGDTNSAILNFAKHSSKHKHALTLAQLYPESHQYIGAAGCGRGRGRGADSGRGSRNARANAGIRGCSGPGRRARGL
jgi:hypothetical protein